jgi:adenylate cyclase
MSALLFALALAASSATSSVSVTSIDPPTSLDGEWHCTVGDDPRFAAPDFDDSAWTTIALPEAGGATCTGAVSWLRRRVLVPPAFQAAPLGVSPGLVEGGFEVFVDGMRIGGHGNVDHRVDALHVGEAFAIPAATLTDGEIVVAVRIGNDPVLFAADPSRRLVPAGPLLVGQMPGVDDRARSIVERTMSDRTLGFFAISLVFVFIAGYHLLLWSLRRDLGGYLWFGICGVLVTTWLTIIELRGTPWLPINAVTAGVVGNFFGSLVNAAIISFFWHFVKRRPPTKPWAYFQFVLVAISLVGFIPGVGLAISVSPPVIIAKIMTPISGAVWLVRQGLKGEKDAWVILAGVAFGAVAAPVQVYFMSTGKHLPVNPAEVAFLFFMMVMAVALAVQFTRSLKDVDTKNHELRDTNASIARFVPFGFLHALDKNSVREVERGDARQREMAVMFCDVRGFTTLAESLGPDQTFRFINEYLSRMEPEIYKGAGFINQYLGDGIMALFPSTTGDMARSGADGAVLGALGMCQALDKLNDQRARAGEVAIRIGIGIHIGQLMIGTIGGGEQLDGGVIGDCVNASARLEGMTKMYGARVLLSGDVVAGLTHTRPTLRHLDSVVAKGKTAPMAIYEVLDADPHKANKAATLSTFTEAQRSYRAGDFNSALQAFERVLAMDPDDGAARLLRERCHTLLTYPPENWSGVYVLSSK